MPRRLVALALLALTGCNARYRPTVPVRFDSAEKHIEVVNLSVDEANGKVRLHTSMPSGTWVRRIALVDPTLPACTGAGKSADLLDVDGHLGPWTPADVSGDHLVKADFWEAADAILEHPVALEWTDEHAGHEQCTRLELVDDRHRWTHAGRWAGGAAAGVTSAFGRVERMKTVFGMYGRVRYTLGERGAFVGSFGIDLVSCDENTCRKAPEDEAQGGAGIVLGVGYDHTLLHVGVFAAGLGVRYSPHILSVPLRNGPDAHLIQEAVVVPRFALTQAAHSPSGLSGNAQTTGLALEFPVGAWMSFRTQEVVPVFGVLFTVAGAP
jgi:hypothetical protein